MKIGNKIKDMDLLLENGVKKNINEFSKKLLIYFYPKDDTPGCTLEAIEFSGLKSKFEEKNIQIIGISKDTIEKHKKFRSKHNLSIDLASDESGKICKLFKVWVEKSMYGKKYMGIERSTFLLDESQKLIKEWRKVKAKGHAKEVFEFISNLT
tara:strand:+ start:260 stop:718 length:459 start_codon:yes stop_codon:yes gene_type:complete